MHDSCNRCREGAHVRNKLSLPCRNSQALQDEDEAVVKSPPASPGPSDEPAYPTRRGTGWTPSSHQQQSRLGGSVDQKEPYEQLPNPPTSNQVRKSVVLTHVLSWDLLLAIFLGSHCWHQFTLHILLLTPFSLVIPCLAPFTIGIPCLAPFTIGIPLVTAINFGIPLQTPLSQGIPLVTPINMYISKCFLWIWWYQ